MRDAHLVVEERIITNMCRYMVRVHPNVWCPRSECLHIQRLDFVGNVSKLKFQTIFLNNVMYLLRP